VSIGEKAMSDPSTVDLSAFNASLIANAFSQVQAKRSEQGAGEKSSSSSCKVATWKESLDFSERDLRAALPVNLPRIALSLPTLDPLLLAGDENRRADYSRLVPGRASNLPSRRYTQALASLSRWVSQFFTLVLAAIVSILLAIGIGMLELGPLLGPLLASLTASTLCVAALAYVWRRRMNGVFLVVSAAFGRVREATRKAPQALEEFMLLPATQLEGVIDKIVEEQQPGLATMFRFEEVLKARNVYDFEAPRASELRQPLRGCARATAAAARGTGRELMEQLEQLASFRLAIGQAAFARRAVHMPLAAALVLNVFLSLLQVLPAAHLAPRAAASGEPALGPLPANVHGFLRPAARRLREASSDSEWGFEQEVLACLRPASVQVALICVQAMVSMAFARGPFICALVNNEICDLQATFNSIANKRASQVTEFILKPSFAEVRGKADVFFHKFADSMELLGEVARHANKLQGLEKQAKRFGF
jgi:hypothetical protein